MTAKAERIIGVYRLIHTPSGRCYIGSSRNVEKRCREHLSLLARGEHHNGVLQSVFDEGGQHAFRWEVVEIVRNPLHLVAREQYHIDCGDNLLNQRKIADKSLGVRLSAEARAKISAANKGRKLSPEHIAKLGAARRGTKLPDSAKVAIGKRSRELWATPEYREKTQRRMQGHNRSPEACANMGAAHQGQKRTPEQRERMRQSHLGKKPAPEQVAKRAAAMRTRWADPAYRAKMIEAKALDRMRAHGETPVVSGLDRDGQPVAWEGAP